MTNLKHFCKGLLALSLLCITPMSASFKFSSPTSTLKLKDSNAQLKLETPITGFNGTLRIEGKTNNSVQGATGSDIITFSNGILASGAESLVLKGKYDPNAGDSIILGNNELLEVASGTLQAMSINSVVGNECVIKGAPSLAGAITFLGSDEETTYGLKIGIQNKLTKDITLNGGKLTLIDDLRLQDGIKLNGNGTVDIGNFTLELANTIGNAWAGNITFNNAQDIQLNGYTVLTGQWTFADESGSSFLNGNGNVLDISGGGIIAVAAGHTLYISDVHIKGLGDLLGYFDINATGTVKMSNVTIEMGGSYTHGSGTLYVQGDNCKLIAGGTSGSNYTFTVNSDGLITVDHAVLLYEILGGTNSSPFSFASGANYSLINGGVIRSSQLDTSSFLVSSDLSGYVQSGDLSGYVQTGDLTGYVQTGDLTGYVQTGDLAGYVQTGDLTGYVQTGDLSSYALAADIPVIPGDQTFDVTDSPVTLTYNSLLTGGTRILLTNTPTGAQSLTLNGGGFFVQFPAYASSYFNVANGIQLTLTNIVLKDFNGSSINFVGNNSLSFDDNSVIELSDDITVDAAAPWTFNGDTIIDGGGHTIRLTAALEGYSTTPTFAINGTSILKIRNAKLSLNSLYSIYTANAAGTLELENVEVCVESSDFIYNVGNLNIKGNVCIRGTDVTTPGAATNFNFISTGLLTVQKASILEINGNVNFKYQATPAGGDTLADTKRHFKLSDPSATLYLNGCVFTSTNTGFALDYGNLIIEDTVTFAISSADAAEAEFGTALNVNIKAGATLEVGGPLKYVSTSYVP